MKIHLPNGKVVTLPPVDHETASMDPSFKAALDPEFRDHVAQVLEESRKNEAEIARLRAIPRRRF